MKRLTLALLTLIVPLCGPAAAQDYPTRPVRWLVPAPAGGGADLLARTLAERIGPALGQSVVIENRPGAGGNIAAEAVARATPDGHTLLMTDAAALVINPSLYPSLPFDPMADLTPVARLASFPFLLLAHPSVPATTLPELIALARSRPGQLAYASTGIGTPQHLGGEMFRSMAGGLDIVHVPYRGGAPAVVDLLSGQVQLGFVGVPPTLGHIQAGRLRALGVSSRQREPVLPDVPTIAEGGLPGYEAVVWFALMGPARLPAAITARLKAVTDAALAEPAVRERLASLGFTIFPADPAEFQDFLRSETAKWRALVIASGARVE